MNRAIIAAIAATLFATDTDAQVATRTAPSQQATFEMSVANIMRGPEHYGDAPANIRWTDDGKWIYFRWKPGGMKWHESMSLYRVRVDGGAPEKLNDAQADSAAVIIAGGDISPDKRWRVASWDGDVYLVDRTTLRVRQVTDTRATERSAVFARDGRSLFYLVDDNIHQRDLATGDVRQLTDVRTGPAPAEPQPARGQRGFLEQQQLQLFDHIRLEDAQRGTADSMQNARRARDPLKAVYLERGERIAGLEVDRHSRYAVVTTARPSAETRATPVPFWITRSGYTENRDVRTKVGDAQTPPGRVGIISLNTGDVRWLDVAKSRTPDDSASLGTTRFLGWNENGTRGLIAANSPAFKDAWLWSLDAATGATTLITHDRDTAWVGGACAFWQNSACVGFLPGGESVYFVSERDGFAHLYAVPAAGGTARPLTSGRFEVRSVRLSPDERSFFLTTSEGDLGQQHFYTMPVNGGARTRITAGEGRHDVMPSPDGRRLAVVHSTRDTPPELYVADNRAGAALRRVTHSPTAEWLAGPWIEPEVVNIPARDGVNVPARIYRPSDFGAQPNGAAVIFVHGAGYLQNAHKWWSDYSREYMFHHLLAQRGYVVLDLDYRGSAGYGRDWRTAIYRHMGGKDLTDQVDASRWLNTTYRIDPERVGIYGGSYGGFITLMALFTEPKSFGAGAALRSVTDWAHYNHGYTGAILNLPHDDTVAYRRSSPIYFAEGLEDPLLIAHGMVDVNVHYSDVVRLTQRLIELGKTGWELASYPVEDHAFVQPTSWTDEYRRILELFDRSIGSPQR